MVGDNGNFEIGLSIFGLRDLGLRELPFFISNIKIQNEFFQAPVLFYIKKK